ncbi:MAG: RimK family alpha-L-glutamate ligase [Planctomycetota bacterium]
MPGDVEVVLATASHVSSEIDKDSALVVAALAERRISAAVRAWDQPFDWEDAPLVVVRSTWDYHRRLDEFLAWARRVARTTRLVNPLAVVEWNARKSYLLDLDARDVPIVPTVLLRAGSAADLSAHERLGDTVVVKPAVGANASGAARGRRDDAAVVAQLHALLRDGDALVQPFVPSVATRGESSLLFFGGVFSHAVLKRPAPGDYRVQHDHGGVASPHEPTRRELAVARDALDAAPERTAYARVDLVEHEGVPVVMELELIEPEVFLPYAPRAAGVFAKVLEGQLRR